MRSITAIAAAILLAGSLTAHAQNTEGNLSPKVHSTHHSKASDRTRTNRRVEREPTTIGDEYTIAPVIPKGEAGGSLPNYFKNCEEPIVPRFCPP
jgi:hypothetical protein